MILQNLPCLAVHEIEYVPARGRPNAHVLLAQRCEVEVFLRESMEIAPSGVTVSSIDMASSGATMSSLEMASSSPGFEHSEFFPTGPPWPPRIPGSRNRSGAPCRP